MKVDSPRPTQAGKGFRTEGDITTFFSPPQAAGSAPADPATPATPSTPTKTPTGSGGSTPTGRRHHRTPSSKSSRAAKLLIQELEQPPAAAAAAGAGIESLPSVEGLPSTADLPADSLQDLLGKASETAGDEDPLAALSAAAAKMDPGAAPSAISLGAALAGLTELAGPEDRLLQDHFATEDMNLAGLRRGKKKPSLSGKLEMEDAHAAVFPFFGDTTRAFFGVFDGFAGKDAAQAASKVVPAELAKQIAARGISTDLTEVWKAVFEESDKQLTEFEYIGTTCTSLFLWQVDGQRYVQTANVGDSNAYVYRAGKAVMLSTEHKVTSPGERQRLRDMGVEVTPNQTRINGIAVARALGNRFVKEMKLGIVGTPSVSQPVALAPDDTLIIIASDGLWDVITGQAAFELIEKEPDATAMATKLIKHAVACAKCLDNVTVIVVRL